MFPDSCIVCSVGLRLPPTRWTIRTSRATLCLLTWAGTDQNSPFIFPFLFLPFDRKHFSFNIFKRNCKSWLAWYLKKHKKTIIIEQFKLFLTELIPTCLHQALSLSLSLWIHRCVPSLSPRLRLLWPRLHGDGLGTSSRVFFPNWPWYVVVSPPPLSSFLCCYQRVWVNLSEKAVKQRRPTTNDNNV